MDAALFVFEQAVSESVFAEQRPVEYTAGVLAAALREGHTGPVFLPAEALYHSGSGGQHL
jgi:hypothetical protein